MALKSLFGKGGDKAAPPPATPLSGDETTIAPSPATRSLADEKMQPTTTATTPESRSTSHDNGLIAPDHIKSSQDAEKKTEQEEEEEDDTEYPKKMQLVLISVALCLSVFCMVGAFLNTVAACFVLTTCFPRPSTTPLSQQLFHASQISSSQSTKSVGTDLPTS